VETGIKCHYEWFFELSPVFEHFTWNPDETSDESGSEFALKTLSVGTTT